MNTVVSIINKPGYDFHDDIEQHKTVSKKLFSGENTIRIGEASAEITATEVSVGCMFMLSFITNELHNKYGFKILNDMYLKINKALLFSTILYGAIVLAGTFDSDDYYTNLMNWTLEIIYPMCIECLNK